MNFNEAFNLMKQGKKVKLPSWGGYWALENDTIMMHCKNGETIDLFDSDRKIFTLENIASDEWMESTKENTPILGGRITLTFPQALKYLLKGKKMRREKWDEEAVVFFNGFIEGFKGEFKYKNKDIVCNYEFGYEDAIANDWDFYETKD